MNISVALGSHADSTINRLAKNKGNRAKLKQRIRLEVDTIAAFLDAKRLGLATYPHDELVPQDFSERLLSEQEGIPREIILQTPRRSAAPTKVPPLSVLSAEAIRAEREVAETIDIIKTGIPDQGSSATAGRARRRTMLRLFQFVFSQVRAGASKDIYMNSNSRNYAILAESLRRITAERNHPPIRAAIIRSYQTNTAKRRNAELTKATIQSSQAAAWILAGYAADRLITQPLLRWGTVSSRQFSEYQSCFSSRITHCPIVPVSRTEIAADPTCADSAESTCEELAGGSGSDGATFLSWAGALLTGIPASVGCSIPALAHIGELSNKLQAAYQYERIRHAFAQEAKRTKEPT